LTLCGRFSKCRPVARGEDQVDYLAAFSTELDATTDRPERQALLIGSLVDPKLDVDAYIRQLDELADQVDQRMPAGAVGRAQAEALITVLHHEMEFFGNAENYYDPANSFLHRVLDTRLGLPITLSLLYIAVGRRLGIDLQGMGFPGHFMLEYRDGGDSWLLDPFHGKVVGPEELSNYLSQIFQQPIRFSGSLKQYRVNANALILRILNNLRAVYISRRRLAEALSVLDYMVIVKPEEATLWRDRGLLHYGLDSLLAAENDLRRYFLHRNLLPLFIGEAEMAFSRVALGEWMPEVEQEPTDEDRRVLFVVKQIRESIRRLN
jgi:regulator of sirC expression with transglutaminase-like and TPR domain